MDSATIAKALHIIAIMAIPLLFAIVVHEVSHGWVANRLGDDTAYRMGRLTLNPIKHIDPIGTIIVPIVIAMFSSFIFGWAKPVPVNWNNLKHPKRDMALVALAGPASNLLMAIGWAILAKLVFLIMSNHLSHHPSETPLLLGLFFFSCYFGILINLVLMVLNLIPIPPLDGSRVVASFLSPPLSTWYEKIEPFGFFILLGLLFGGHLAAILIHPVSFLMHTISATFGLPKLQ